MGRGMSKYGDGIDEYLKEILVEEIIDRRERPPLPINRPPGPKWQAKKGLYRLRLNGAEFRVMGCLIDRANQHSGNCWPSVNFISRWAFLPERTVERALSSLKAKKLFRVIDRGLFSNAYILNWNSLFWAYAEILAVEKGNKEKHLQTVAAQSAKSGGTVPAKSDAKTLEVEPWNKNPSHISAPSSDGEYVVLLRGNEEGIQRGEVEGLSTNLQPPAEPNVYTFININAEKTEVAAAAVEAELLRHPLYGALGPSWKLICRMRRRRSLARAVPARSSYWLALRKGRHHERQRHLLSWIPFC
jgi:hypothetical protein